MELVFATNNRDKIKEIQAMMPAKITVVSLKDIGCFEDIPETMNTIEANAIQKATYVYENYGYDCFADDTGLEVKALNGEPGVFSARYAGEEKNPKKNMQKLLDNLGDETDRAAHFKTVIALYANNKLTTYTGICKGEITHQKKGNKGFGYDPIFKPEGSETTFAEMTMSSKNKISHRAKAIKKLVDNINNALAE